MPASAIFMPQRARRNNMDYFYEHESELFTFYRVPKVLFTEEPFKNMNCEAKLLYGLLLDKMGLSRKSGWFDKQGRAFLYYGISHIMEMSRNVQSGNTQNLKSIVIQRSFPKWSVAERRKTAAASDQAAVCACAHSRYFAGGSPSGLRV